LITPPHDPSPELVPAPDVVVPAEAVANVAPVEFSGSTMFSSDCVLRNGDVMKARVENLEDMVQLLRTDYADGLTAADVKKFADVLSEMTLPLKTQQKHAMDMAHEIFELAGMKPPVARPPVFVRPHNPRGSSFSGDISDFLTSLLESDTVSNLRYGILFLLALSSLGVYSIILAGWSSNSKYAFIGALRSAAQMISYEVAISLIILPIVILSGSLDLSMITHMQQVTTWFCFPLLPIALLFLIAMLAETNRTPFDLPEAEAELVAGYNVDYSSLPFAMFFLGEYCNMILISTVFCLLFLSGGLNALGLSSAFVLSAKAAITWVFFVLVRATLPRYRYDQLMDIG